MAYRFLKFTSSYSGFERQFLKENPDYNACSYVELFDRFVNSFFYIRHSEYLRELGNQTQTHNASIKALQVLWAQEHGVKFSQKTWLKDIVIAQIEAFDPEIIFLEDLYLFDRNFRNEIRARCKNPVKIMGYRAAPTADFLQFSDLDLMISAAPNFVERMRELHINAHLLPLAFEERSLAGIGPRTRDLGFTFLGSVGSSNGPFSSRYHLIESLLAQTPLEVWGDFVPDTKIAGFFSASFIPSPIRSAGHSLMKTLDLQMNPSSVFKRIHAPVFGKDYYSVLSRSKMTFNCHIDCSEQYAGNIRLFEATGMGACLITDRKKNITDFFEPDVEILTYRGQEECVEKVKYYLVHDDEREQIARAGQRRTLCDHTYRKRMEKLDEYITDIL